MKKIIKILPIILFIVLFLAITPSYVVKADADVTFQGGRDSSVIGDADTVTVTGITPSLKNHSSFLYCANKWHGAVYADGIWTGTRQILRGTAETYLFANVDVTTLGEEGTKYDGQEAYWQMKGAEVPEYENSLYMGANEYESWVNGSHSVSVDKSKAELSLSDDKSEEKISLSDDKSKEIISLIDNKSETKPSLISAAKISLISAISVAKSSLSDDKSEAKPSLISETKPSLSDDKSEAKPSLSDKYGIIIYGPITIVPSDYAVINGETLGGYTWSAEPAGAVELINYNGGQYLQIDITKLNGSKRVTFSVYSNVKIYSAVVYNLTGTYPRTCTTNKYSRTRIPRSKCSTMWTRWTTRLCKCAFSK